MAPRAISKLGDREGRGRLSSIDLLPEDAEPDIAWALEQLRDRTMPSNAILTEFNARLADRGIGSISKSAWGRYSVRKAIQFRKLDEVQRISGELVASMGTDGPDQVTVMIAEMIKVASFQLLEGGDLSSKTLMELSRALSGAVSAQKGSAEYRKKLQDEADAKLKAAANAFAEEGAKKGVSKETIEEINRRLMGGA